MEQEPRLSRTRRGWLSHGRHGVGGALGQALAGAGGTQVEISVTVPNDLRGRSHPARLTVSSLALGKGTLYGTDSGRTGERLTVRFRLPPA